MWDVMRTDAGGAFCFAVSVILVGRLLYWIGQRVTHQNGHWTYEIDDYNGDLLYVGECKDIRVRMRRHRSLQAKLPDGHPRKWWPQVHPDVERELWPSRVKWHASTELGKQAEKDMIRRLRPPANIIRYKGVTGVE
jgi:hypothetical protein